MRSQHCPRPRSVASLPDFDDMLDSRKVTVDGRAGLMRISRTSRWAYAGIAAMLGLTLALPLKAGDPPKGETADEAAAREKLNGILEKFDEAQNHTRTLTASFT